MTALDQAFIKAYVQRRATPAVVPDSARCISLADVLEDHPLPSAAEIASGGNIEVPALVCPPQLADPPPEDTAGAGSPADVCPPAAEPARDESDPAPFWPMFQVDHFVWPKICRRLGDTAAPELDRLTVALAAAVERGRKVLAVGGCRRGEGSTTLLLCAARCLAKRGLKVIMIDGDLGDPQLAERLGLLPESGWEKVLAGRMPLEEAVVESDRDQLAVLPLCEPIADVAETTAAESGLADTLETLRNGYNLVLVDLGPLEEATAAGDLLHRRLADHVDAIVLVHNVCATSQDRLVELQCSLAAAGMAQVGVIQNFVRP
jgi:Mrp family chromosome partitioning ATPase